jgi:O-acetyl-ADP-ribose deacetylase (regulator of RNase III)
MIKIVNGDILDAKENVIAHQVNCMGVMGGGLAKQIKDKYPEVYDKYKQLCANKPFKEDLLSSALICKTKDGKYIANLFGQYNYGKNAIQTDYMALKLSLKGLVRECLSLHHILEGKSIAIPYNIGCGLGGGDWNIVYKIIEEVFKDYDVTICKL